MTSLPLAGARLFTRFQRNKRPYFRSLVTHSHATFMAHANHPVFYRYKHFPLHSDTTMLCISVTGEDIAPLEGNQQLWANLLANAVKKHGRGKTLGVLRIGDQTYVPEPREGVPSAEWNTFKQFSDDRPAEDHENWPVDSATTTQ